MHDVDFLIVGTPRSGTTFAQKMIGSLNGVVVPPETHFWVHSAAELVEHFNFPLDPGDIEEALSRFFSLPSSKGLVRASSETVDRSLTLRELFGVIVRTLCMRDDNIVVGEKTPDHLLVAEPLMAITPALKVIGVIRDPRAVVHSNLAVPFGMDRPELIAQKWRRDAESLISLRRAFPDRVLVVKYETLVRAPSDARAEVAAFLGVANSGDEQDAGPIYVSHETWKDNVDKAPDATRISQWRVTMNEQDVATVERFTWPLADSFGYEAGPVAQRDRHLSSIAREEIAARVFDLRRSRRVRSLRRLALWS